MGRLIERKTIVGDEFRCPACGQVLLRRNKAVVTPCPHLVYALAWSAGDPDSFLFVRPDFAQRLVDAVQNDPTVCEAMEDDEIAVSQEDCHAFLVGSFQPGDRIAELFGSLPVDFHSLLGPIAVVYCDDRLHSGVHLVVEGS